MTRIGNLYLEREMYDKAYEYFKNVAEDPTTTPVQRNAVMAYMALAMERLGDFSAAAGLYDTLALEYTAVVVPENPNLDALEAPLKAAQMWLRTGDAGKHDRELQKAREYYREIAQKFKGTLTESAAMAKLAASYLQENRYGEATDILRSIRDDSSGFVSPGVLMSIADIYMNRANDLPNAERTYRDYIRYYPQQENAQSAYLGLGLSLYGQGKYEEARKSVQGMEKLPKIGQENLAQSYFLTALCYEKEDKWELARGQFDIVQTSFMGTDQGFEAALHVVDHYRQHGQTELAVGAFNDAVNYINKYVEQNSANPVAVSRGLGYLVRAYTENGDMEKAAEQLSLLHARYPQQPEGKFAPLRLSEIYANSLYDTSKAISWLKLFVDENPDSPDLGKIKSQVETLEKLSGK
jgi:TolA-binding protein